MNFGDVPDGYHEYEKSSIVIIPVPYDGTSTYGKGADKGPATMIQASFQVELYDIDTDTEVYKRGIHTDKPVSEGSSPEKMVQAVYNRVKEHLSKEKFSVVLGGEHSVSVGAIQAYAEKYKDLTVLQFDAHSDLRDEYHGSKFNHACVMARAKECAKLVQVGIRASDSSEKDSYGDVIFAKDIHEPYWQDHVLAKLGHNVYITFDLDGFDSSLMPSTGTPEPGGLFWWQAMEMIRKVAMHKNIVGFDVVELMPIKGLHAPDFLAAKLVYCMLSYAFWRKK